MNDEQEQQPRAEQDWHTRARVRILSTKIAHSHDGEHTFHAGDEVVMVQWGRAGRPIDRSAWWSSFDIDGAFIIESDKTEIVQILDEVAPLAEQDWKTIEAQAAADLASVQSDQDAYTFIKQYLASDLQGRLLAIYHSDRHEMLRSPKQALENLLALPPLE